MSDEDKPRKKSRSYPGKKVKNIKRSQYTRTKTVKKSLPKRLPRNHRCRYENILKLLKEIKATATYYYQDVIEGTGCDHGYLINRIVYILPGGTKRLIKIITRDIGDRYFIDKDHEDYFGNKPHTCFMKIVLPWHFFYPMCSNTTLFVHTRKGDFSGKSCGKEVEHTPLKIDKGFLKLLDYLAEEGFVGSGISEEKIELDSQGNMIPIMQGDKMLWVDDYPVADDQRFLNYYGIIRLFKTMIEEGWDYEVNYDFSVEDMYDRTELVFTKGRSRRIFTFTVVNEHYEKYNYRRHSDPYVKINLCEHGEGWGPRYYTINGGYGSGYVRGKFNKYLPNCFLNITTIHGFRSSDYGFSWLVKLLTKMGVRGLHFYRGKTPPKKITKGDFPSLAQVDNFYGWR